MIAFILQKIPRRLTGCGGKAPPPNGLPEFIYAVASGHLRWHVAGPPESWFVFISTLSKRYQNHAVEHGAELWPAPYDGHPDHGR